MTTLTLTAADSSIMLRRNLIRIARNPMLLYSILVMPLVILLMMRYFFGGAIATALPGDASGSDYMNFLVPGILVFVPSFLTVTVAVSVSSDMTDGFHNRLRSLDTPPTAILAGHVVGAIIQGILGLTVLIGAALLLGFRPNAGLGAWAAALGLLLLLMIGLVWVAVAMGVLAKSPEHASNLPMPLLLLPYLGSSLVPTDTMPNGIRQFAEYQPFSPTADTVRGLLLGTDIDGRWPWALFWCAVLILGGYLWAISAYRRAAAD